MKQVVFILLLLLSLTLSASSKKKEEIKKYDENFRAQFHFSPEINKMGNPISIWKNDTIYQLYFQYNPHNLLPGYINWGLATSTDLIHWKQNGLVIKQPETTTDSMQQVPWWGSVCPVQQGAIAWVTRWNDVIYKTTSTNGIDWEPEIKTTGPDVLLQSEAQVFWHEPSQKWVMVAFDRITTTMVIFNSENGADWEQTSSFNYTFGYPQLFELQVDRKPGDTRWVLATEKGTYMLGNFDGKTFQLETSVRKFNHSKKIGATSFFFDQNNERMLGLSLLEGEQLADLPSNGQLTFPFEFMLHEYETGIEMIQQPIQELQTLHDKMYRWEARKIYPGIKNNLLNGVKGKELHLKGVIDIMNCDQFGFLIRSNKNSEGTEISYNVKKAVLNFLGTQLDYKPANNKIEIELLIDRSSIELLIDGGRYVISYPFTPVPESLRYELFTIGGEIMVDKMEVQQLKSVWIEE